ncbi:hypothetical protein BN871_CR_00340 [Paenibacillus sp. P22]|nr:hypothetical protein BN871_CR_00340 [Paenibacillus sp. P22]
MSWFGGGRPPFSSSSDGDCQEKVTDGSSFFRKSSWVEPRFHDKLEPLPLIRKLLKRRGNYEAQYLVVVRFPRDCPCRNDSAVCHGLLSAGACLGRFHRIPGISLCMAGSAAFRVG